MNEGESIDVGVGIESLAVWATSGTDGGVASLPHPEDVLRESDPLGDDRNGVPRDGVWRWRGFHGSNLLGLSNHCQSVYLDKPLTIQ